MFKSILIGTLLVTASVALVASVAFMPVLGSDGSVCLFCYALAAGLAASIA
jgi:hypothetical protein